MALSCPIKSSKEYQDLLEEVGESRVYLEWNKRYNEDWNKKPQSKEAPKFQKIENLGPIDKEDLLKQLEAKPSMQKRDPKSLKTGVLVKNQQNSIDADMNDIRRKLLGVETANESKFWWIIDKKQAGHFGQKGNKIFYVKIDEALLKEWNDQFNKGKSGEQLSMFQSKKGKIKSDNYSYSREISFKEFYETPGKKSIAAATIKLAKVFGIPVKIVKNLTSDTSLLKGAFTSEGVLLDIDQMSDDTPLHEFLHPFIDEVKKTNPALYNSLIQELRNSKEGKAEIARVKKSYKGDQKYIEEEALVSFMGKVGAGMMVTQDERQLSKWRQLWLDLKEFIANMFNRTFKKTLDSTYLTGDMSIKEILELIKNADTINVSYSNAATNFQKVNNSFDRAIKMGNERQGELIEKFRNLSEEVRFAADKKNYKVGSESIPSLSTLIREKPEYEINTGQEENTKHRDWGIIGNTIFEKVLEGVEEGQVIEAVQDLQLDNGSFSEEGISNTYNALKLYVQEKEKEGNVFLSNVSIYTNNQEGAEYEKAATTLDAVMIDKEGIVTPIDLYTTWVDLSNPKFTSTSDNKASVSDYYRYRLSAQRGMLTANGFNTQPKGKLLMNSVEYKDDIVLSAALQEEQNYDLDYRVSEQFVGDTELKSSLDNNSKLIKTVHNLQKGIQQEIDNLQKAPKEIAKKKTARMRHLLEMLKGADYTEALLRFIESVNDFVKGNSERGIPSIKEDVQTFMDSIAEDVANTSDTIMRLYPFLDLAKTLEEVNRDVKKYYVELQAEGVLYSDELMQTLNNTQNSLEEVISLINNDLTKKVAYTIGNSEQGVKVVEDFIKELEQRGDEDSLKKAEKLKAGEITPENLMSIFREGLPFDIGILDAATTSLVNQAPAPIKAFGKHFNNTIQQQVKEPMLRLAFHTQNAVNKYAKDSGKNKDNVSSFYTPFMEEWTLKKTRKDKDGNLKTEFIKTKGFAQEVDYEKYSEEEVKMLQRTEDLEYKDKLAQRREWYEDNLQQIPEKDQTITNPETGEEVVIRKGYRSVVTEKLQDLKDNYGGDFKYYEDGRVEIYRLEKKGEKEVPVIDRSSTFFQEWTSWAEDYAPMRNDVRYYEGGMFKMPSLTKYQSAKYKAIQDDAVKKRFYDFLIAQYFKKQESYPMRVTTEQRYFLPGFRKSTKHRIVQNNIQSSIGDFFENMVMKQEGQDEIYHQEGNTIPILFNQPIEASEVSQDLAASVLMYSTFASKYKALAKMEGIAKFVKDSLKDKMPFKKSPSFGSVLNRAATKIGLRGDEAQDRKDSSNAFESIKRFMEMNFYGQRRDKTEWHIPIINKTIDVTKGVNTLTGFAALTQIALNIPLSVTEYTNTMTQMASEAVAGEYVTPKELAQAHSDYFGKYTGDIMRDSTNASPKTFAGQLLELYGLDIQQFDRGFGQDIGQSAGNRALDPNSLFFTMKASGHVTQGITIFALLRNAKVKDAQGNEISLIDAYEQAPGSNGEKGYIRLKEGIELDGGSLTHLDTYNKIKHFSKRHRGIMAQEDKPFLEQTNWGQAIMMYRRFVPPGAKKRFKAIGYEAELGDISEGTYVTWFNHNLYRVKKMFDKANKMPDRNLQPFERANIRRAATELLAIQVTGMLASLLIAAATALDDGDDETADLYFYPALLMYRLNMELGFFGGGLDPYDAWRTLGTPTIAASSVERWYNLLTQFGSFNEEYERKTGMWEKGDSKLVAKFAKVAGITGYNWNPDEALKVMASYAGGNLKSNWRYRMFANTMGIEED